MQHKVMLDDDALGRLGGLNGVCAFANLISSPERSPTHSETRIDNYESMLTGVLLPASFVTLLLQRCNPILSLPFNHESIADKLHRPASAFRTSLSPTVYIFEL
jgi:hypothetical protein